MSCSPTLLRLLLVGIGGLTLIFGAHPAIAQDATDVFLVSFDEGDDGLSLGEPQNLTRRDAYDNQPAFSKDGKTLYYTRQSGQGETAQTDIWQIELDKKERSPKALFETPESEYSPTPMPGGNALSVIRVEPDGSQKLWQLPLNDEKPSRILDAVEPVGYHAWAGKELVLFVLGEPHELQRTRSDQKAAKGRMVAKDIGRALKKVPGKNAFSFVHKSVEGQEGWWIQQLDVSSDELTPLIRTFDGREDFTWSPDGKLWMADGSKLYRYCPSCGGDWVQIADLEPKGIRDITRLAISPDGRHLAFVANHPKQNP